MARRILSGSLLALALSLAVGACSSEPEAPEADAAPGEADAATAECETEAPSECAEPAPVYADIAPIVEARCVGCHDGTNDNWPLTSYTHVADWNVEIRGAMLSCSMPPAGSGIDMPTAERQQLLMWIRCGFRE